MKNVPEKIFLQVGPDCPDDVDFDDLSGVTWSREREYETDIEFRVANESMHLYDVRFNSPYGPSQMVTETFLAANKADAMQQFWNGKNPDRFDVYWVSERPSNDKPVSVGISQKKYDIHRTHCCTEHGCKYGDKDCPVELGLIKQDYICIICLDQNLREL